MFDSLTPIQLGLSKTGFPSMDSMPSMGSTEASTGHSFKDVLVNLVKEADNTLSEPGNLMKQAMTTGGVDIHDVMIANAKADLALSVTTQTVTKAIQAYDRILQIQV